MNQVPHGCTIRARFDAETDTFLRQLSLQIATNVSQFVAQEHAPGSYGVRKPFHVTILELSPMLSVPYVMAKVNEIAYKTARLVGKVLPLCQVCDNGEVRIKIDCTEIVALGAELCKNLPGSNGWSSQSNDTLFVSIGMFHGVHRVDFETWLNNELSTNNKELFPTFFADFLAFSDEWQFAAHANNQTVALGGGFGSVLSTAAASHTAVLPNVKVADGLDDLALTPDMEGLLNSFTLSADEAAMANVDEDEDAVLAAAAQEAEDGDLDGANDARTSEAPYQPTIAPAGGSVWGSVNAAHGKIAPPKQIIAMSDSANRSGSMTKCNVAPVVAAKRSGGTVRVVASAKLSVASTKAAEKPKEESTTKSEAGSADVDHSHGLPSNKSVPDWQCPSCKVSVFARKMQCYKCKTAKPSVATSASSAVALATNYVASATPVTDNRGPTGVVAAAGTARVAVAPGGGTHLYPRKPKDGDVRDGDWICSGCKGHNFASKIACFTCRSARPPGYVIDTPDATAGDVKADRKPGDWTCPKCNENVFAKRNRCYKCSTSKPKSVSGDATHA